MNNADTSAWRFVEKYYPNYTSCDSIAESDDLCKMVEDPNEIEDGDCSDQLLKERYNNDLNNPQIKADYYELMNEIYEKAIENFLKIQSKEISKIIFYDGYDEVRNLDTNEVLFSAKLPEEIADDLDRSTMNYIVINHVVDIWNSGGDIDQYLLNESLCSQEEREIITDALNLIVV